MTIELCVGPSTRPWSFRPWLDRDPPAPPPLLSVTLPDPRAARGLPASSTPHARGWGPGRPSSGASAWAERRGSAPGSAAGQPHTPGAPRLPSCASRGLPASGGAAASWLVLPGSQGTAPDPGCCTRQDHPAGRRDPPTRSPEARPERTHGCRDCSHLSTRGESSAWCLAGGTEAWAPCRVEGAPEAKVRPAAEAPGRGWGGGGGVLA